MSNEEEAFPRQGQRAADLQLTVFENLQTTF